MEEIREEKKGDRRDLVSAPAFPPFLDPISAEEKERQAFQPFFWRPSLMNISPEQEYVECAIFAHLTKKVLFRTLRTSLAAGKASEALPFSSYFLLNIIGFRFLLLLLLLPTYGYMLRYPPRCSEA